jgi:hypothetical protein
MFGSVSEHFANLRHVKRCKTCVSCLNTLFRGTEAVKHPFYSIGPKLIFGSVWEHFANLRQVKRCKTCVPSLNALFRGTKVVKHLHWIENDVWECFGAFRKPSTGKHMQNLCFGSEYTVSGYQSCETSPLDRKWCLGVFRSISQTFDRYTYAKLVFRVWIHCFGVPKLWSIHSTPLDPNCCLGVFQSILLTFDR